MNSANGAERAGVSSRGTARLFGLLLLGLVAWTSPPGVAQERAPAGPAENIRDSIRRYVAVGETRPWGFESRDGVLVAALELAAEPLATAGAVVDLESHADRAYLLYESGALQNLGAGPSIEGAVIAIGRAVDLEFGPTGNNLFVLDDTGMIQAVLGEPPAWLRGNPTPVEMPVALLVREDGAYVLDQFGIVHPFGNAPPVQSPQDEPLAADLEVGPDGRLYLLDALGRVLLLSPVDPPRTVLESAPEASLAVDLTFDPVTQEPVVLYEDGSTRHRFAPLPPLPDVDFRGLEFLSVDALPDWISRFPTRLAFPLERFDVNLLDGAFPVPIGIENALNVTFLDFRLHTGRLLRAVDFDAGSESLLPAGARITVATRQDSYRFSIDLGASPEAEALQGTGPLFNIWLSPAGEGRTSIAADQLRWSMRGTSSFVSPAEQSRAAVAVHIRNPEPSARLAFLPAPGVVLEDQARSRAHGIRGATAVAEFRVDSVSGLAGLAFDFVFDSTRIRVVSLSPSGLLEEAGPVVQRLGDLDAMNASGRGENLALSVLGETAGFRGGGGVFMMAFALEKPGLARIRLEEVLAITASGRLFSIPIQSHPLELEVR